MDNSLGFRVLGSVGAPQISNPEPEAEHKDIYRDKRERETERDTCTWVHRDLVNNRESMDKRMDNETETVFWSSCYRVLA